jgi:hypothetical protein
VCVVGFVAALQANQFDLENEDVADLLGDTAFTCADAVSNHTDEGTWLCV